MINTIKLLILSSLCFSSSAFAEDAKQLELISLWRSAENCQITLAPSVDAWIKAMINSSDGLVTGQAIDSADRDFGQHVAGKLIVTFCWATRDRLIGVGLL